MRNGGRDGAPWVVEPPKQHDVSFLAWGPFRRVCKYHKFAEVVARLHGPQWLSFFNGRGNTLQFLLSGWICMVKRSWSSAVEQLKTPSGTWWVKELGVRSFQNCGAGSEYTIVFLSPNSKCIIFSGAHSFRARDVLGQFIGPRPRMILRRFPGWWESFWASTKNNTLENPEFSLQPRIYLRERSFAESMV